LTQSDYQYKTEPYAHQHEAFLLSRDEEAFALLMEMGTGKSKVIVDTSAWLYGCGNIDALVVVAPNGVHTNWTLKEVPVHMPDHIPVVSGYWVASPRKHERAALENLFKQESGPLRVVAMNIEALSTKKGTAFLRRLLNTFRTLLTVDESSRIKTPGVARTRNLVNLGKFASYRRILTGTSITQGPLDLYAQYAFLNRHIIGHSTFTSFKSHFALYERRKVNNKRGFYDALVSYRNLSELTDLIRPVTYRKLKKDCLDLPQKIYEVYPVELSKEQRRIYDDALKKTVVELRRSEGMSDDATLFDAENFEDEILKYLQSDGTKTQIKNALTRLLRLQQIVGGFFTDEEGKVHAIDEKNARVDALMNVIDETQAKWIIWARFRPEIAAIAEALREKYGRGSVVEYHGGVEDDDRTEAVARFQGERHHVNAKTGEHRIEPVDLSDQARFFVGQPRSGGIGITLTAAEYVAYFSNDFSLETRLQSEDRAHRIGQKKNVTYVDLQAAGTIDDRITSILLDKQRLSDTVLDAL